MSTLPQLGENTCEWEPLTAPGSQFECGDDGLPWSPSLEECEGPHSHSRENYILDMELPREQSVQVEGEQQNSLHYLDEEGEESPRSHSKGATNVSQEQTKEPGNLVEEGGRHFLRPLSVEDDLKVKEDDCWEPGSKREHLGSLPIGCGDVGDQTHRDKDGPDQSLTRGHGGAQTMVTPEPGTVPVSTQSGGTMVIQVGSPTVEQRGEPCISQLISEGRFVDSTSTVDIRDVVIPETTSVESGVDITSIDITSTNIDTAVVMNKRENEGITITITAEPSIDRSSNHQNTSEKPSEKIFSNTSISELGEDQNHVRGGSNNTPPPSPPKLDIMKQSDIRSEAGTGDKMIVPESSNDDKKSIMKGGIKTCQYVKGGYCLSHGGGAIRKQRGGYRMTIGKGGVPERRYQRETYYVCDLGQGGRGRRLVQTKLSFKTGTG